LNNIQELSQLVANLSVEQLQSDAGKALTRRLIRLSYEAWCRYRVGKVGRKPAEHHLLIIRTIQKLLDGELLPIRKIMFLMPPGAAKSTYTSMLLPPWLVNPLRFPNDLVLACSYSYTLAESFGKECRNILEEESDVLGVGLSRTSSAAGDWRTTLPGGGYFCAGTDAGIAGHRARVGFIDDYLGKEQEASSDNILEKLWKWYNNDYWPRLLPGAYEIIMANRRAERDLVGRLLDAQSGKWLVIKLPYFARENDPLGRQPAPLNLLFTENKKPAEELKEVEEAVIKTRLWPEWFDEEHAREVLAKDPETRAGLFQQDPTPEEGNYFKKDWIVGYRPGDLPKNLRPYAGSDWALRKEDRNDLTCHVPAGVDDNGFLWILPWWWMKADTLEGVQAMFDIAKRHKPITWWHGRENITGSIGPFIYQKMREDKTFIPIEELSESRNLETKAQSIKARMSAKMVMFPTYLPDWERALHELLFFPNGAHDDFVAAIAKLGQGLADMVPAAKPQKQWDGKIPEQRLTCKWIEESHKRRERGLVTSDY
jgi:hypothetical protein